ncbi:xanthine dehydrogenase family protein molybdopterin-binding subunit [Pontibacter qinzhouensis]|uniref:Xanthine dehydrogenase family protein molybdopterin-binding subunit n=1 Tax=Pontibacter qinzhouensis TaxID=2603253 RepID=A0A5C8KDA0_9BACT|nr:xanthine dehydrogenase family protein molybdopterin-binding subunit [Pontibacter qinzhouensis]TXK49122.1 xanthine dehydrogenase family protein molybdopterin-binding subunit [Pontibacter qinzhouensis]
MKQVGEPMSRVDGRLKVTGAAKYSAEIQLPDLVHAVLVESTIAKGRIKHIDSKLAERAPGVLAVLSHVNAPKVPGYAQRDHPTEPSTRGQPLRVFYDDKVYSNGQPIAMVVADTLERARYAAKLVKVEYTKEEHQTNFHANVEKAVLPSQAKKNPKSPLADYVRGTEDAYKTAAIKLESEYVMPSETHNPMELQAITAHWEATDKLTVYDKTQAVKGTQRAFANEWKIPAENVKVIAKFVGGAFGNGLHTWPHETAAIIAAKKVNRPVKLMLTREQMFTMVGYRPYTWQKVGMSATPDGKLTAITHEAIGQTSSYEEFTESTLQQTKMMYACPNITTRYRILPLDVSTPIWMRGPGEATGAFALESAMDEMAHQLNLDPIEFRMRNHTDTDPDKKLPWSTKYLKECMQLGAERIGWKNRSLTPGAVRAGEWQVGYGMGVGTFGANQGGAGARARLLPDGTIIIQSATTDIGPGTGTAMVQIAADALGITPNRIKFELGDSAFPNSPSQGGSSTISSVGSAVKEVCFTLKQELQKLGGAAFSGAKTENVMIGEEGISLPGNAAAVSFADLLQQHQLESLVVTAEAEPGKERRHYSLYSFSVHFVEVQVHPVTGVIRITKIVSCADAGTIINEKTAANQMIGGAVGGIGMALMEAAVIDHRYGRYVTKDLAEYHVPVHGDIPKAEVIFINKPDLISNPLGTKGIGEIALIGMAPAVANAVFNATGKRIRNLPITPDKLLI